MSTQSIVKIKGFNTVSLKGGGYSLQRDPLDHLAPMKSVAEIYRMADDTGMAVDFSPATNAYTRQPPKWVPMFPRDEHPSFTFDDYLEWLIDGGFPRMSYREWVSSNL